MHDAWYERAAWIYFALLSGTVLPLAFLVYLDPSTGEQLWARFGHELPASVAADPRATAYVEFISHWASTGTIGFDLFGLLIATTAFRRAERWAWLAFCWWPVLFATHFVTYESGFRYMQLVWLALSVGALAATYRKVWTSPVDEAAPAMSRRPAGS
jgi:hypothetical protein